MRPINGALNVSLHRAEIAYEENNPEEDRLECPCCSHRFPVPEEVPMAFEARNI
jgi:uncharacterized protein YbaR (Trm112 family)